MTPAATPILLVEDMPSMQMVYRSVLAAAGHRVIVAGTAAEGLAAFRAEAPQVVLLDLMLPDREGLDLMQDMLADRPETRVVIITASSSVDKAVRAMRGGAHDFLVKPFDEQRLLSAVANALPESAPPPGTPAGPAATLPDDPVILGASEPMARIHATIRSAARSMATVFITGECGTGKELCAQSVHRYSPRAAGPFIALNCAAIQPEHLDGAGLPAAQSQGAIAAADGGTLFLDEVCEMPPALQTRLMRFLNTSTIHPAGAAAPRPANVRIVCASSRDPLDAVRRGQFREDLYYRLYVVPIHLPPLRDRGDDVIEIAEAALARIAAEEGRSFLGLSAEVCDLFRSLPWPGNIRQVLNVIRNVVVLHDGGLVLPGMLPDDLTRHHPAAAGPPAAGASPAAPDLDRLIGRSLAEIERIVIEATLDRHGGSVPKAARVLDLSPSTLYRKLESWDRRQG